MIDARLLGWLKPVHWHGVDNFMLRHRFLNKRNGDIIQNGLHRHSAVLQKILCSWRDSQIARIVSPQLLKLY
jgi:hypothetical protein